jgi:hypothetical protein
MELEVAEWAKKQMDERMRMLQAEAESARRERSDDRSEASARLRAVTSRLQMTFSSAAHMEKQIGVLSSNLKIAEQKLGACEEREAKHVATKAACDEEERERFEAALKKALGDQGGAERRTRECEQDKADLRKRAEDAEASHNTQIAEVRGELDATRERLRRAENSIGLSAEAERRAQKWIRERGEATILPEVYRRIEAWTKREVDRRY